MSRSKREEETEDDGLRNFLASIWKFVWRHFSFRLFAFQCASVFSVIQIKSFSLTTSKWNRTTSTNTQVCHHAISQPCHYCHVCMPLLHHAKLPHRHYPNLPNCRLASLPSCQFATATALACQYAILPLSQCTTLPSPEPTTWLPRQFTFRRQYQSDTPPPRGDGKK